MLSVYHSNNMEVLRHLTVQLIKNDPLEGVFTQEKILVQNAGMSQWLKLSLANDIGIVANVDFPMPSSFIWDCFKKVMPDIPKTSAFTKEGMIWPLIELIPKLYNDDPYTVLKSYVGDDPTGTRLYQLSVRIADQFDKYLVFRPDWILEWEKGEFDSNPEVFADHPWQPMLWKELHEYMVSIDHSPFHRANLFKRFISTLASSDFNPDVLPKRLFMFGVNTLPPQVLAALVALGEHVDVQLMLHNPCRYFWGDIKDRKYLYKLKSGSRRKISLSSNEILDSGASQTLKDPDLELSDDETLDLSVGNTLLASMGKSGRDYLSMLSEVTSSETEIFIDNSRNSLLGNIQQDILQLEDKFFDKEIDSNRLKGVVKKDDKSITIHNCYSAMREVMALHDYLLKRFDKDTSLQPIDVVVMISDIDLYTPYIKTIFGNANRDRYIPFSISDRSTQSENPILKSFLQLLDIERDRCTFTDVMNLLDIPAVSRRFNIDTDDIETIKQWVSESGVRWGADEETSEGLDLPSQYLNTWQFGLDRMIMGYAIPEQSGDFQDILPYEESQGNDAVLAGKIGVFIEEIQNIRKVCKEEHNIDQWMDVLNQLIETFFEPDSDEEGTIRLIKEKISGLYKQLKSAKYENTLSFQVVYNHFYGQFSKDRISQNFMLGKVTFGTLMPMRSIPFKTVCLLGMEDSRYPRTPPKDTLSLMTKDQRLGDRSGRDDDRYLFLEALLSAQDNLYISYTGQSMQDGTPKNPSVLINELIEYCQKGYCLEGDGELLAEEAEDKLINNISFTHPLTPYSPENFTGEFHSYAEEWVGPSNNQDIEKPSFLNNQLTEDKENSSISNPTIDDFLNFWRLPVKHFFSKRLKVTYENYTDVANDEESFTLDGLEAFKIKEDWLNNLISTIPSETINKDVFNKTLKTNTQKGVMPHGNFALLSLMDNQEDVEGISDSIKELHEVKLDDIEINYTTEIDGKPFCISGWVTNHFDSGLVFYRTGRLRSQDIINAWVSHLVCCASNRKMVTNIISRDGHHYFETIPKAEAEELLKVYIAGYISGMTTPLPFLPKTSLAATDVFTKSKTAINPDNPLTIEKCSKKMEAAFYGGFGFIGEESNPYVKRVWPDFESYIEPIYRAAIEYLLPPAERLVKKQ